MNRKWTKALFPFGVSMCALLRIRRMKKTMLSLLSIMPIFTLIPISAMATTSNCDAVTGNLVTNCGFEAGTYTSTEGGYTSASVPIGWTSNLGFNQELGYNHPTTSPILYSGNYALSIGNLSTQPVPALSQILTDVAGQTYNASVYILYGGAGTSDTTPFFNTRINSTNYVSLTGQTGPSSWTQERFSFVGTGSDTLTFTGNTNPSEWYVDDVVVTGTAVPIPAAAWLMLSGLVGVGAMARKRRTA